MTDLVAVAELVEVALLGLLVAWEDKVLSVEEAVGVEVTLLALLRVAREDKVLSVEEADGDCRVEEVKRLVRVTAK